jgi:osmotically-inducible protein OsmY
MKSILFGALLVSSALFAGACSERTQDRAEDTAQSAADDAERNTENAAERSGDALERAGDATADAARDAADATRDAVTTAGRVADAAIQTFDVKAALTGDSRVDASNIDVDTDHQTKTVTLKGRVPTAAQKTVAGDIAKSEADGYSIRNELTVGR